MTIAVKQMRHSVLPAVVTIVLAISIVVPIGYLIWGALWSDSPTVPGSHFTWDTLRDVFLSASFLRAFGNTLILAISVSAIVLALGTTLAIIFIRVRLYGSGVLRLGIMAPLFISPFVATVAWVTLYEPGSGLVNSALVAMGLPEVDISSVVGTIILMSAVLVPYAFILISDAMARTNEETEDAARVCGASGVRVLRSVTLPSLTPALVSVFTITFVLAAEMFSIPGLLATQDGFFTLSYQIYFQTVRYPVNLPAAAAAGLALIAISIIGILFHLRMTRLSSRYVSVGGKAAGLRTNLVTPTTRLILTILVALYIIVTVVGPMLALVLRSLTPYFSGTIDWAQMSLQPYIDMLSNPATHLALSNSLILCAVAAVLAVIVSGYVGHYTVRNNGFLSRSMNVIANLPLGLPGTVLGVGLIWTFIGTPVYGTLLIIALGIFVRWLPTTIRVTQTSVMQISPEFGQAADIAGATTRQKVRTIHAPLLRSGLAAAALMAFNFTFNEITSTALLVSGRTQTLAMMVFSYTFDGNYPKASVIAVIQTVVLFAFAAAILGLLQNQGAQAKAERIVARAVKRAERDRKKGADQGRNTNINLPAQDVREPIDQVVA